MKMTKRIAAMAACAVMALSTTMSVTASAIDTSEQITSVSESTNTTITVINSISGYSNYAETQIGSSCWASCILSVLKYHDYRTTETLETIYTRANRLTSSNMSVGDGISPSKLPVVISDYLGMSSISPYSLHFDEIYNHIAAKEPLIGVINSGGGNKHTYVIYGFEGYKYTSSGSLYITKFRVMNPTDGTCSTITMDNYSWDSFYAYSNLL